MDEQGPDESVDTESIKAGCELSKNPLEVEDIINIVEKNKKEWNSESRREAWSKEK